MDTKSFHLHIKKDGAINNKDMVTGLLEAGLAPQQIIKTTNVPQSSVYRYKQEFEEGR